MKVYNYNETTKEFIDETIASSNVHEPGKYLIPKNATTIKPKKNKKDFVQVFIDDTWIHQKDQRKKTVYDTETKQSLKIDYLGELKENHTFLKPFMYQTWDSKELIWLDDELKKKEYFINKAKTEIEEKRYEIERNNSLSEMSSWESKRKIADKIIDNLATDDEINIFQVEADLRDITIEELANKIIANNNKYLKLEAFISGFIKKTKTKLNEANIEDIETVYAEIIEEYKQKIEVLND